MYYVERSTQALATHSRRSANPHALDHFTEDEIAEGIRKAGQLAGLGHRARTTEVGFTRRSTSDVRGFWEINGLAG